MDRLRYTTGTEIKGDESEVCVSMDQGQGCVQ